MADEPLISRPLRPLATISRASYQLPGGCWDTHVHVFGPPERYPHVQNPRYTLPDGTIDQYRPLMSRLGIEHFVLVQPSFYGTDNSCLLDTLRGCGDIARGVAMLDATIQDSDLRELHEVGIRAIRLDLFKRANDSPQAVRDHIDSMARKAKPLGWHLQFYAPGALVLELFDFLADLPVDFVIDHMGYLHEQPGSSDKQLERLLELLTGSHCHLKLSGSYRLAQHGSDEWIDQMARAIVERAPERVLWGSDWPHISFSEVDTGELASRLAQWAPSEQLRRAILVDNPARLFA